MLKLIAIATLLKTTVYLHLRLHSVIIILVGWYSVRWQRFPVQWNTLPYYHKHQPAVSWWHTLFAPIRSRVQKVSNGNIKQNAWRKLPWLSKTCSKDSWQESQGDEPFWVFSDTVQVSADGMLVENEDESPLLWLQHLVHRKNILLQESLKCTISTPLDSGQSLSDLCLAIRAFMPENFAAAMATINAVIMGSNYTSILKMFGCLWSTNSHGTTRTM